MSTDVNEFITDLDGSVFAQKVSKALSIVAAGVVDHEKAGKVTLTFDIKKLGSQQVSIEHKLAFVKPTQRGKQSEDDATTTAMYVAPGGAMSFFQPDQTQMFSKTGEVNDTEKV